MATATAAGNPPQAEITAPKVIEPKEAADLLANFGKDPGEPSAPAPERSAFDELEDLDAANPSPDSRPPKRPAPDKDKAAPKPQDKGQKPPEKKVEPAAVKPEGDPKGKETPGDAKLPPEPNAPASDPTAKFQMASDLRREYRSLHAKHEEATRRLAELEKATPDQNSPQFKALTSKVQELEAQNAKMEEEIRYHDYTKSNEYKQKYLTPFKDKLSAAYDQVAEMTALNPDGTERPATAADFDLVLEAPKEDARRLAKERFGEEYFHEVLQYRRELNEIRKKAEDEARSYKDKAKERETTQITETSKQRQEQEALFTSAMKTYTEKYPEHFGKVEGDDEMNAALDKGFAAADAAYDPKLPLAERVNLVAANRLKAAAFGRHILKIKRLEKALAEAKETIAGYEKSAPPEGDGSRSGASGASSDEIPDAYAEIDRIDAANPIQR